MGSDNNEELVRIMSVDDSRLMRKSVSRILKGLNDVVEAEHGEQAWELLQQDETIKIVCCDLSMPVMDGFGFLEKVRSAEDPRIRNLPVIIVTGQEDSEENRNRIFEAGASDFVSKPFDSAQLRACIKTHTRLEQTAEELEKKTTELEIGAAVDPLTGLGTQAFFYKSAQQAISHASRHERELIIINLQIDGLRELFIKVGKGTCGALIKKVGEILSKHSRQEDLVCRMGLDGYVTLLTTCDLSGAVQMTERVREMVASVRFQHDGQKEKLTISAGVAKVDVKAEMSADDLLQASANYLKQAQEAGGNQVGYDKSMVKVEPVGELTLDQALTLISRGESNQVRGQVDILVRRILPLLALYARVNANGARQLIEKLQERIK
jgi:two-component system, cell cycle response regulator